MLPTTAGSQLDASAGKKMLTASQTAHSELGKKSLGQMRSYTRLGASPYSTQTKNNSGEVDMASNDYLAQQNQELI